MGIACLGGCLLGGRRRLRDGQLHLWLGHAARGNDQAGDVRAGWPDQRHGLRGEQAGRLRPGVVDAGNPGIEVAIKKLPITSPQPSIIVDVSQAPPELGLATYGDVIYNQQEQDNSNDPVVQVNSALHSASVAGQATEECAEGSHQRTRCRFALAPAGAVDAKPTDPGHKWVFLVRIAGVRRAVV